MNVTVYHIIIPPVIIVVSIILIVILFLHVRKRAIKETEKKVIEKDDDVSDHLVQSDGIVDITVDHDRSVSKDDHEEKKGKEVITKTKADVLVENIVDREKIMIKRITADPRDTEAYELLGQVYLVQNNFTDAAECFQQICILDPEHTSAMRQLHRVQKIIQSKKSEKE